MPAQILHVLFGEDLADALLPYAPQTWSRSRWDEACQAAFAAGCQGPDLFYHSRRTRPLALAYGSLLHRRGFGDFCVRLLKTALPAPSQGMNPCGAYALGFLSHAALDRACHPYIIYKSAGIPAGHEGNGLYHPFLERILDALMLKRLRGIETAEWNQGPLTKACSNPPPGLKGLIAEALRAAFPEKAAADASLALRIDGAFADSARFYSLTDPAKTLAETLDAPPPLNRRYLSVVYPLNLPGDIDFLNLSQKPWHYPYRPPSIATQESPAAKPDTRSFPEIYADALKTAANAITPCIARYLETGVLPPEAAAEGIGNGGLSIQDGEGKPCGPNFSRPLPLDAVLERQCRMRENRNLARLEIPTPAPYTQ